MLRRADLDRPACRSPTDFFSPPAAGVLIGLHAEDHEGVIDADNEFPSTIAAVEPCRPGACRSALPAEAAGPVRELLRLFALLGRHKGPAGEEEAGLCIELREGAYAEFTMFVPSRKAPFEAEVMGLRAIPDPAELHEGADVLLAFVEQGQAMWPQLETEEQFARRLVGISHGPWEVGLLQTIARPCLGRMAVRSRESLRLEDLEKLEATWKAQQRALRAVAQLQGQLSRRRGHRAGRHAAAAPAVGISKAGDAVQALPSAGDPDDSESDDASSAVSWPAADLPAAEGVQAGARGWVGWHGPTGFLPV